MQKINIVGWDKEYNKILYEIKEKIQSARIKAAISVNKELLSLYWDIGKIITEKQKESKYGDSILEMLANDLAKEFPGMNGFSRTNLFNIRQWYSFYSKADTKVQQLVGQLPWGHNVVIINKIKNENEAEFYIKETIKNNWSRNVLILLTIIAPLIEVSFSALKFLFIKIENIINAYQQVNFQVT